MGKRNTSVLKALRLIRPQCFTGIGKWKWKFLLVWQVIFRHKNLAHVPNCALRILMHEMLIYIYLNSVKLISLFLMIRMQQQMANHKYFSRITHWFGSNRKGFFTCMAMVLYKECVQQSTSVLRPAPVNCLYLLHLQRDLSECTHPLCRVRYSQYYSHIPQLVTTKT